MRRRIRVKSGDEEKNRGGSVLDVRMNMQQIPSNITKLFHPLSLSLSWSITPSLVIALHGAWGSRCFGVSLLIQVIHIDTHSHPDDVSLLGFIVGFDKDEEWEEGENMRDWILGWMNEEKRRKEEEGKYLIMLMQHQTHLQDTREREGGRTKSPFA